MKAMTVALIATLAAPLAAQTATPPAAPATPQAAATPTATTTVPAAPALIPVGSRVGYTPVAGYDDGGRRDPFSSLVVPKRTQNSSRDGGGLVHAGLSGIALADVNVRGISKAGATMLAILEGPNKQSYVTRVKDRLADATVVAIDTDGVTFAEQTDAGVPASQVKKTLRPAGEGIR